MELFDIVDEKNRVNYEQLKNLVSKMSLSEFVEKAKHPMLVGKGLFDGIIRRKTGEGASTETIRFSLNPMTAKVEKPPVHGEQPAGTMSQAIFVLAKKKYARDDLNTFFIGRSAENDIVIADFVVSKKHASITFSEGFYYLCDLGSTNGTRIEGMPIPQMSMNQLKTGNTISFGRIGFVFAHPLAVYRGIRKEIYGA